MTMDQVFLCITSVLAIVFVNAKTEEYRRWGPVAGCLGQPFWFYTAYTNEQWGIFAMCFVYAFAWLRGLYNHWSHFWRK